MIRLYHSTDKQCWDAYVMSHPDATHCHLSAWKDIIEKTYGHKGHYLLAEEAGKTRGIVPVFQMRSFLFGNQLVSVPFLNYGGILADNEDIEKALLFETLKLARELKANTIELRHLRPLSCLKGLESLDAMNRSTAAEKHCRTFNSSTSAQQHLSTNIVPLTGGSPINPINLFTRAHKLRMLLQLPESGEELFKSYNAKLRSQIRRPQKEGMNSVIGGAELLNDFYKVFSTNMRDLGSPVHSKTLFKEVLSYFGDEAKIGIVNYKNQPVAAGMIIRFKNTVEIPWASSLRSYNQYSPNMLLYWSFLEYACSKGHQYFDFGRSTPGEGTHRFKEQWGAKGSPIYWHNILLNGRPVAESGLEKSKFQTAIRYWKKLPLPISNAFGPMIRKQISL